MTFSPMLTQGEFLHRLCHVAKMLDQFHANNSNADKHDTRCKACCAEYEKQKRARKTRVHEPTVNEKKCRCTREPPLLPRGEPGFPAPPRLGVPMPPFS